MSTLATRAGPNQVFRIGSVVVPTWLAWYVAFSAPHPSALIEAVKLTLAPLWVLVSLGLLARAGAAHWHRQSSAPALAQVNILTGSGAALAWLSAFAIMGAVWLGWASLAVVGLLGTALFHIVVLLAFVALWSDDPMRKGSIQRRFSPEVVTEGDEVTEELRFSGTRVPVGFRLFVSGRLGPRWATTRHAIDAAESGGEVVVTSEIGPAVRGDHDAEPLQVWLEDIFGLCRSARVPAGPARLTVLPRLRAPETTAPLLDRGEGPRAPTPLSRLPTEGSFRLREYQHGDDVRRIHWVRSVAARELIVRLPDELPPDRPHVRLVLDTFFPAVSTFACDAPSALLDSMVGVWLALARGLVESGVRVTLVTAVPQVAPRGRTAPSIGVERHELVRRTTDPALRLGARVRWQSEHAVDELLTDESTFVVSRAVLVRPPEHGKTRWIVVLPTGLTQEAWPFTSGARFPFPMGSAENRWSHRRREGNRLAVARRDHAAALWAMRTDVARPPPGSFVAVPTINGAVRLEALR